MGSMYLPGCLHKRLDLLQIYHVRQCLFLVLFDYVLVSCSSIAGYLSVHYRIISYLASQTQMLRTYTDKKQSTDRIRNHCF